MTLAEAFEIVLTMTRAEYNRNARDASLVSVTRVRLEALEAVTAFYYINVKGS